MADTTPGSTPSDADAQSLSDRVKNLLRRDLKLGEGARIADDMPLIGGEFELDSLDVVLLIGSVEKEFGIKLPRDASAARVFGSVDAIVRFLQTHANGSENASTNGSSISHPTSSISHSLDDVLARLPHAEPFRFVSRLTDLDPGQAAQGVWDVTGDEAFFAGHFPGRPLVPGVLIGEALAQLSGLIAAADLDPDRAVGVGLAHLDVRLRKPVPPPAAITLLARRHQTHGSLMHCAVEARVNGEVVADGSLVLNLG